MTALATTDPDSCPDCGEPLRRIEVNQPALFIHGGYGHGDQTIYASCPCGWSIQRERNATNPRGNT